MNENQTFSVPKSIVWLFIILGGVQLIREILPPASDAALVFFLSFSNFQEGIFNVSTFHGVVTHILIHSGWWHLLANCTWIIVIGPRVFPYLGGPRFFVFFFATGIVGACVHAVLNWGANELLIGASGAVFGLLGAGAFVLVRGRDGVSRPNGQDIAQYVLLIMIVNVGYAILSPGNVSWEAHAGGFLAGLIFYPIMRRKPF